MPDNVTEECKDCLQSWKVIEIITGEDEDAKEKLKNCIRLLKEDFKKGVVVSNADHVRCVDIAFENTIKAFFRAVSEGKFSIDSEEIITHCINYLFTIFHNKYYTCYRNAERRKEIRIIVAGGLQISRLNDVERKILRDAIEFVVKKLSTNDQEIYQLKYVEELSNPEIAIRLRISLHVVEQRVYIFRRNFRREWNNLFNN